MIDESIRTGTTTKGRDESNARLLLPWRRERNQAQQTHGSWSTVATINVSSHRSNFYFPDERGVIETEPVAAVALFLANRKVSTSSDAKDSHDSVPIAASERLSVKFVDEARRRFEEALAEADEEDIPQPNDGVLSNAFRVVRVMDEHCPQEVSSVVVREEGMAATVRGSNRNYVTVECEDNGEVLVLFNVRSYARFKDMDEVEKDGFFKSLLKTLRY